MRNQSESIYFIKYIFFKGGLFKFIGFNIKKILFKIFYQKPRNNYPRNIQDDIDKIFNRMQYLDIEIHSLKNNKTTRKIKLASRYIELSTSIDWDIKYDDYEDYEALHRFRWIRDICSKKNNLSIDDINFIEIIVMSWYIYNKSKMESPDLSWCSHTLSERICNIIVLKELVKKRKISSDFIDKLLNNFIKNLLTKLEYYPYGFGNHLINNMRSILIYSLVYKNSDLEKISFKLIKNTLDEFIFNSYTLDQSSHYQILLYYWLYDISHFSNKYSRSQISTVINQYVKILGKSSLNFISKNNHMIYFGDISPDYSPNYLLKLITNDYSGDYNPYNLYNKI